MNSNIGLYICNFVLLVNNLLPKSLDTINILINSEIKLKMQMFLPNKINVFTTEYLKCYDEKTNNFHKLNIATVTIMVLLIYAMSYALIDTGILCLISYRIVVFLL